MPSGGGGFGVGFTTALSDALNRLGSQFSQALVQRHQTQLQEHQEQRQVFSALLQSGNPELQALGFAGLLEEKQKPGLFRKQKTSPAYEQAKTIFSRIQEASKDGGAGVDTLLGGGAGPDPSAPAAMSGKALPQGNIGAAAVPSFGAPAGAPSLAPGTAAAGVADAAPGLPQLLAGGAGGAAGAPAAGAAPAAAPAAAPTDDYDYAIKTLSSDRYKLHPTMQKLRSLFEAGRAAGMPFAEAQKAAQLELFPNRAALMRTETSAAARQQSIKWSPSPVSGADLLKAGVTEAAGVPVEEGGWYRAALDPATMQFSGAAPMQRALRTIQIKRANEQGRPETLTLDADTMQVLRRDDAPVQNKLFYDQQEGTVSSVAPSFSRPAGGSRGSATPAAAAQPAEAGKVSGAPELPAPLPGAAPAAVPRGTTTGTAGETAPGTTRIAPRRTLAKEESLSKMFEKEMKPYIDSGDTVQKMMSVGDDDGASQMATLYGFIHNLDRSVVRPSEFETIKSAQTLVDRWQTNVKRGLNEDIIVAPTLVQKLKKIAEAQFDSSVEKQAQAYSKFLKKAKDEKLDPGFVIGTGLHPALRDGLQRRAGQGKLSDAEKNLLKLMAELGVQ